MQVQPPIQNGGCMDISPFLNQIKYKKPLINIISNGVTRNFIADSMLAIGCSPIMAEATEELADIIPRCDALVINTGTPTKQKKDQYKRAIQLAREYRIPLVLDFPGVGSSEFRSSIANEIIALLDSTFASKNRREADWPVCIRGNAKEIIELQHSTDRSVPYNRTVGIDSDSISDNALLNAEHLLKYVPLVHISGNENIICARDTNKAHLPSMKIERVPGGHEFMRLGSGFGCTNSAVNAALLSLTKNAAFESFACVCAAQHIMLQAGKTAANYSGPGTFKTAFIDSLYNLITQNNINNPITKGELYAHN